MTQNKSNATARSPDTLSNMPDRKNIRKSVQRLATACIATFSLTACTSEGIHYYTLRTASAGPIPVQQAAPFLINVLPVGIPAELDQPQIVIRQGDNMLVPLDTERWASSLDDEIRNALSAELADQLGTQDTAGLASPAGKPLLRIKVQIRQFDASPGHEVYLRAGWSIIPAEDAGKIALTCFGQFDAKTAGGYPEMVQAQKRVLTTLATRIATDTRSRAQSHTAVCSQ